MAHQPTQPCFSASVGLFGAALAVACGSTATGGTSTPAVDGGGDESLGLPSGDLGGEAGPLSDAVAPAPQTNLRVAHLSPDLPPLDVCVAPHGTTHWSGPLLGQLSGVEAGAPGLTYSQVSTYLPLDSGQYDLLIVPAGSTSCTSVALDADAPADGPSADANDAGAIDAGVPSFDAGVPSDAGALPTTPITTTLPELAPGGYATLLIAGELSPSANDPGLTTAVVRDDAQLAGGAAALRAINALPRGGPLDFDLGSFATKWTVLLANVAFGAASTQAGTHNGAADANGYVSISPLSGATMSAHPSSGATVDTVIAKSVAVPLGSVATVIAIGGSAHDSAHPAALLLCIDNQPSGGILSDCSLAQ